MTDKMLIISSEDNSDAFQKSIDNFKPEIDVSRSMISADFDKPNGIPGQLPISGEDADSFVKIRENIVEAELEAKGYINVMKKLPPKIPIERIIRKNKKDIPNIKNFSEKTKRSGTSDSFKKLTPSTEKRLSGERDHPEKETESIDEEENEIDPFTNEQNVAMDKIMLDKGKSSSEEEKITDVKTKVPSSKRRRKKNEEEKKMDNVMNGLRGHSKKKGKKMTTESSSSSEYSSDESDFKKVRLMTIYNRIKRKIHGIIWGLRLRKIIQAAKPLEIKK